MPFVPGVITGAIIRFSKSDTHQLEENTVFDPALFFYMLLPPIIFAAGYNVQKVRGLASSQILQWDMSEVIAMRERSENRCRGSGACYRHARSYLR